MSFLQTEGENFVVSSANQGDRYPNIYKNREEGNYDTDRVIPIAQALSRHGFSGDELIKIANNAPNVLTAEEGEGNGPNYQAQDLFIIGTAMSNLVEQGGSLAGEQVAEKPVSLPQHNTGSDHSRN